MTTYYLNPPTVLQTPIAWDRLNARFSMIRGIAILQRMDGSFYESMSPAQTELEELQAYWLGGYTHTITQTQADQLTTAGYGSYITTGP